MAKEASSTKCLIRVKFGSSGAQAGRPLFPSRTDIVSVTTHVRKVPKPEVANKSHAKPPEGGSQIQT